MPTPSLLQCHDPQLEQRERKYLPDVDAARAFWRTASAQLRPEHGPHAVAYSRTTYFDTADLAYYRSRGGPIMRRVRVREYALASDPEGSPSLSEHCYLELKQSVGSMRSKVRIRVRPAEVLAELASLTDACLAPCVTTWYRRRALVDVERGVRVTLDDLVLLTRPRQLGSEFQLDPTEILARGPALVLECKTNGAPPAWLARALTGMHEARTFSKFILGMNAVVRNNFATHSPEDPRVADHARSDDHFANDEVVIDDRIAAAG